MQVKDPKTGRFVSVDVLSRFYENFERITESGCWIWTGSTMSGYGWLSVPKGEEAKMHRFSWKLHNGPIPTDRWVLHHCDVRQCVNPYHLYLGTPRDNVLDAVRRNRIKRRPGSLHPQAKLMEEDVSFIRHLYNAELKTQEEIGDYFGVTQVLISRILLGKAWRHTLCKLC